MSSIYIAEGLNSILKTWEDMNLTKEAGFHCKRFLGNQMDSDFAVPLIGSELNKYGALARSIPDYKNLRNVLSGSSFIHPTNFLPKIPKEERDEYISSEEYCRCNPVFTSVLIPSFLLNWLETRRACVIEDTAPIPFIDLRKENWFGNIPYHSFYLRVNSPIVFDFKTAPNFDEQEWSMQDFLVYENIDSVNILAWATENENFHLSHKEQEDMLAITKRLKTLKFKNFKQLTEIESKLIASSKVYGFYLGFSIKKGTTLINPFGYDISHGEVDIYALASGKNSVDKIFLGNNPEAWSQLILKFKMTVELLNGFCKLMSHLPKNQNVLSIESTTHDLLSKPRLKWFELYTQNVDHLETESKGNSVVIRRSTGSEKSPHVRRAHFRRIVRANGIVENIWIEETIIRKDKLEHEQLQGGALRVK